MTTISAVTTTKYRVVVEDGGTVRVIGDVTSALSAALSAAAAAAAEATATTQAGLASGYATDAQSYMTSALGYRNDAQTAAGTATTQAGLASGYAADAQSYMTSALGYRNDAQTAAGTATTQAGLASGYATDAQSYMTSALGYRNDAQAAAAAAAAAAVTEIAAGTNPASFTTLKTSDNIVVAATKKIYLDGVAGVGGDTYLAESSANLLDLYAGGVNTLRLSSAAATVTGVVDATRATDNPAVIGRSTSGIGGYQFLAEGRYNAYGAGIAMASRTSSGGTLVPMAKIVADGTAPWSTDPTTQDAQLTVHVAQDGVLSQVGAWNYSYLSVSGHITTLAKSGGDAGVFTGSAVGSRSAYIYANATYAAFGDTNSLAGTHFIIDKTNTQMIFQVGNAVKGCWKTDGLALNATQKLYLDGGSNTYLVEGSADTIDIYAGGVKQAWVTTANQFGIGDRLALKRSNFGYSAAYGVLQLGLLGSNAAISLGVDVSGNPSGGFTGNEIVLPHSKNFISPNAANTAFNVVMSVGTDGGLTLSNNLTLAATKKLYLDGGGDTYLVESSANVLDFYAGGAKTLSLSSTGAAVTGTIGTTDPAGGAGPAWKFGVAASVSPTSPNRTLRVDVAGTSYYLAAKTTND